MTLQRVQAGPSVPVGPAFAGRRVVVIGAGYGGIAIAIRRQARRHQVTLRDAARLPDDRGRNPIAGTFAR